MLKRPMSDEEDLDDPWEYEMEDVVKPLDFNDYSHLDGHLEPDIAEVIENVLPPEDYSSEEIDGPSEIESTETEVQAEAYNLLDELILEQTITGED